jgi:hypothetical protein
VRSTYVFDVVCHGGGVILVFEQRLDGFSSCVQVFDVGLVVHFLLLVLANSLTDVVSLCELEVNSFDVKQFTLGPVINVEVGVSEAVTQSTYLLLGARLALLLVAEHHSGLIAVDVVVQVQLLILVEHIKEHLVVLDTLILVAHVLLDIFYQGL